MQLSRYARLPTLFHIRRDSGCSDLNGIFGYWCAQSKTLKSCFPGRSPSTARIAASIAMNTRSNFSEPYWCASPISGRLRRDDCAFEN
jgi:hypothetical protein